MDENKFAFIICTNDEMFFEECLFYIQRLNIPRGYSYEVIPVRNAQSMCSGYNYAMKQSDARYKIYMHQDAFIINSDFLSHILYIFGSDPGIGMIGLVGAPKLPADCVPWHTDRIGNLYAVDNENINFDGYDIKTERLAAVEAVDGFMMVTREDLPWREDLFDGWDFYDCSQSAEFIKRGLQVVVPEQKVPWCIHEDGIMSLWNYEKYRQIFIREYKKIKAIPEP